MTVRPDFDLVVLGGGSAGFGGQMSRRTGGPKFETRAKLEDGSQCHRFDALVDLQDPSTRERHGQSREANRRTLSIAGLCPGDRPRSVDECGFPISVRA